MNALVYKLKSEFSDKVSDLYNEEVYFIKTCKKFESKYSLQQQINDLSLRIYFEENNKIVIKGEMLKYCKGDSNKRKIKIKDISVDLNQPEIHDVTVINNYMVDDTWEQTDW